VTVRERFRLDGAPIGAAAWEAAFWPLHDAVVGCAVAGAPPPPPVNYFSLLTLLCFSLAASQRMDALVLEVGMGGWGDPTNAVAAGAWRLRASTTLDWDHTEVLGVTLPAIATQKASIFKCGVPARLRRSPPRRWRRAAAARSPPCRCAAPSSSPMPRSRWRWWRRF
jgi:folylpolyglutamate synthase